MVHHEDDRRLGWNAIERLFVGRTQSHPIERPSQKPRKPEAEAEVDIGVEGGNDLVRVASDRVHGHRSRELVSPGVLLGRHGHLGVIDQAIEQHAALGQLERLQADA